jgi:hypothetical protein
LLRLCITFLSFLFLRGFNERNADFQRQDERANISVGFRIEK